MRAVHDGYGQPRHLAGWRRDRAVPPGHDKLLAVSPKAIAEQPPAASLYPLMETIPVYDQGAEGSCTANMGALQYRYLVAKHNAKPFEPSRQNLYKAVRNIEGTPLTEDSGAEARDIMRALRKVGVCSEALDPYDDSMTSYSRPITDAQAADALEHQALFYYRCVGLHAVKQSILQGFPVGFGFSVFASMMTDLVAGTGEVPYPAPGEENIGGHAVTCIGYDDEHAVNGDKGCLLVRNSWGRSWGIKGDFWLPYRYVTDGLAEDFWTLRMVEL